MQNKVKIVDSGIWVIIFLLWLIIGALWNINSRIKENSNIMEQYLKQVELSTRL